MSDSSRHIVQVYVGALSQEYEALSVEAHKKTTAEEIVSCIVDKLRLASNGEYELAEVVGNSHGQECKERRLGSQENPVALMLLWPKDVTAIESAGGSLVDYQETYKFYLREKTGDSLWNESFSSMDPQLIRDYFYRFLYQPKDKEYPDLCQLPDLNELTLLENLRARFAAGHIYTYVGSILIAANPFKFYPIYNPKYVKLYQNRRLDELPPHIFAIADSAYYTMLKERKNQCIVISGESGSGKTESTNFLLHHLTALSQKGSHGSGVEQTILSAGPVLEAFGNAKTAHNNNSSRFGKFIQVNYKENGMVHGAIAQKYLLEKSRICTQAKHERNYHVFYYLLAGATDHEARSLHLLNPEEYHYLNQSGCYTLSGVDESYEFSRLKQSMEMVGFSPEKQGRLFAVLSAVLLLGNVEYQPKKSTYHHDESVLVKNVELVRVISSLLRVKEETLLSALTSKKAKVSGETLVIQYRMPEALAARDAIAKCLYGALFDWIVLQVNYALLSKKEDGREHLGHSIGVLDIFGFEDFGNCNSFEQFCINYANEHLQHYFNQHVFKYEQEEYRREGIAWTHIDFKDNAGCLQLIEGKPSGLLCVLDDQCNFPGATNETLLQKFNSVHKDNEFYEVPQKREAAFIVKHYAGKVKYQVAEFREKNLDLMRQDIVGVMKSSNMAFVRELVGLDPVAVFRWAILRAFFRAYFAFQQAGLRQVQKKKNLKNKEVVTRQRTPNENVISYMNKFSNKPNNKTLVVVSNKSPILGGLRTVLRKETYNRNVECTVISATNEYLINGYVGKRNRSFCPHVSTHRGLKNLQTMKTLARHTQSMVPNKAHGGRKQLTVTAQFQVSLHSLMITLNQANPFFIRCIKSNTQKVPSKFDEDIVQRQLNYTGMLETVRIRQAGYNVRLTFDEFIHHYRILLPNGLLSSQSDVTDFLLSANLHSENYQIGHTKVFMRECEKMKLDHRLHQQIMASIITIQRWFRAALERRNFMQLRGAVVRIQSYVRMFLAQRQRAQLHLRHLAATCIQKMWRGYHVRQWYSNLRQSVVQFQARVRGNLVRRKFTEDLELNRIRRREMEEQREEERRRRRLKEEQERLGVRSTDGNTDSHSAISTDEAFLSKESSQEELDLRVLALPDSDESSGIHEDSGSESMQSEPPLPTHYDLTYLHNNQLLHNSLPVPVATERKKNKNKEKKDSKIKVKSTKVSVECSMSLPETIERRDDSISKRDEIQSLNSIEEPITSHTTKNRFHKAKKQIKTFISGKNRSNQKYHETSSAISVESDSDTEDTLTFGSNGSASTPSLVTMDSITNVTTNGHKSLEEKTREERREERRKYLMEEKTRDERREERKRLISQRQLASGRVVTADVHKSSQYSEDYKWEHHQLRRESRQSVGSRGSQDSLGGGETRRSREASVTSVFSQTESSYSKHEYLYRRESYPVESGGVTSTRTGSVSSDFSGGRRASERRRSHSTSDSLTESIGGELEWRNATLSIVPPASLHKYKRLTKAPKGELCSVCDKSITALFSHVYRCAKCGLIFHGKCMDSGSAIDKPCNCSQPPVTLRDMSKTRPKSTKSIDLKPGGKFSLTGTSEFTDREDKIISDSRELQLMQDFIAKKMYQVEEREGMKGSDVDRVFYRSLREFKDNLLSTVASQRGSEALNIKYKDLIASFECIMANACTSEEVGENFPVTMGVNAFRGFLNEFMSANRRLEVPEKTSKSKRRKEKKRKLEEVINHLGHMFVLTIINIPTACEMCSSFIMWPIERGVVCQNCKLTCHKKCHLKVTNECGKDDAKENQNPSLVACIGNNRVFCVPLQYLVSDVCKIPVVVDRLITNIEMYGLYTEGVYRKSAVTSKVKELKQMIEEDLPNVKFEMYPVHVLASVLKCFFRDMPEPLLTFENYENFLRAADLSQPHDRVTTLFNILKKIPEANYHLMERLVFHLARVALHENSNRMNANALAIVFAPCILRTSKAKQAQDSLLDIGKQTMCIETIVQEQLRKVKTTLADIDHLESACNTASHRLSSLRSSKTHQSEPDPSSAEEKMLTHKIKRLQANKAHLTSVLPSLSRSPSDDDLLSTEVDLTEPDLLSMDTELMDAESPAGSLDDLAASSEDQVDSMPVKFTIGTPPVASKRRVYVPHRKPPTRFCTIVSLEFSGNDTLHRDPSDSSIKSSHNSEYQEDAIMV